MSEVKWIKIVTDIFDDEKVQLIESMPESDSIIVVWFKLLCLAGKQNNSGVFMLNDRIAYTDEMLSTIFRRPLNTVRLALKTFEEFGMIEIINGVVTIPNWEKHQQLDALETAREKNRQRVAKHREQQKLLCNVTVSECNAPRLDKDKDIKEKEKEKNDFQFETLQVEDTNNAQVEEVIRYYNWKAHKRVTTQNKTECKDIYARLNDGHTVEELCLVIDAKYAEWSGDDTKMKYFKPSTLFRPSHFETYLSEAEKYKRVKESKSIRDEAYDIAYDIIVRYFSNTGKYKDLGQEQRENKAFEEVYPLAQAIRDKSGANGYPIRNVKYVINNILAGRMYGVDISKIANAANFSRNIDWIMAKGSDRR